MFTGIIEEIGIVKSIRRGTKSVTLEVSAAKVFAGTQIGDSIATNGVCLTVTDIRQGVPVAKGGPLSSSRDEMRVGGFDVMPETVSRTSLASLRPGSSVNLERALTLQTRLGGHLVSGHVDGTGTVSRIEKDDNALWVYIRTSPQVMRYIIEKGSIAIQGVSLTVAKVMADGFAVSLIPHTQNATTLHGAKVGDVVNLENDVIAKYVEKLLPGVKERKENTGEGVTKSDEDLLNLYRPFLLA